MEKQIKAGIDKKELVLLKFSKKDTEKKLSWKHGHEFEYNRQMYDIVETAVKGDTVFYRCRKDHEETRLNRQLKELVARSGDNNKQDNEAQKRLVNFLKTPYISATFKWNPLPDPGKSICFFYSLRYTSTYSPPPVPPPEISQI